MKITTWLKNLVATKENQETPGIPQSLKEFEKQHVRKTQDELNRTLQILEIECDVASRK